jgi:hypothetical protein
MPAIAFVFTIRRAAEMLGADEDLLWQLSDDLEPEDGVLSVHDTDEIDKRVLRGRGILRQRGRPRGEARRTG